MLALTAFIYYPMYHQQPTIIMMRTSLFLFLTALFALGLRAQEEGYRIEVDVNHLQAEQALLANYFGDKTYKADSAQVSEGHFVFEGEAPLDPGMYIVYFSANKYFEVVIDQDQHFRLQTDTTDLVGNMQVEGSEGNTLFFDDLHFLAAQRQKANQLNAQLQQAAKGTEAHQQAQAGLQKINEEVMSYREQLIANHPDKLYPKMLLTLKEPVVPPPPPDADSLYRFRYYRQHFFDDIDLGDQRLLRTPLLHQKAMQYVDKLTYKHPDSIIVSVDRIISLATDTLVFRYFVQTFLNNYANSKIMGMDAVYVHMVETYYMTGRAYWVDEETLQKMVERAVAISPTLIGRKAPDFRMQTLDGSYLSLHEVKAPYTILYFWDYDCGHCKKVTPKLAEAYQAYIDAGVELITVSINGSIQTWKEKVKEYGLEGIPMADPARKSGFDRKYDVRSTPRLFLLDKDKIIRAKHISVEQMEELLDRFLVEDGLMEPRPEEASDDTPEGDRE